MMELKKVTGNAQVRARLIHPYPAADVVARKRGIHGYNILTEKWSRAQVTFMVNKNRCRICKLLAIFKCWSEAGVYAHRFGMFEIGRKQKTSF